MSELSMLQVTTFLKLTSPTEAQNAPSGFGTFSLIKDGKLLEDHYLSKKRFENIIKQEIKNDLRDGQ